MSKKKILITGGAGFIGLNVGIALSKLGYKITLIDNFYRKESKNNLEIINSSKNLDFQKLSILNTKRINDLIKTNKYFAILNFAGQVAMISSLQNPKNDYLINSTGNLNLLEAVRNFSKDSLYIYTSSNKVYGDLSWDKLKETKNRYESIKFKYGYDTSLPIDLKSPYGCSKGSGDFYTQDYKNSFDLNTIVLRLSTIYGENQFSTYNQGWIGWFIKEFQLNKKTIEISGTGKQVRDILHIEDFSNLIYKIISSNQQLDYVYNAGGGYENSLSLLEFFKYLNNYLNLNPEILHLKERNSDQRYFVSNNSSLNEKFNWVPKIDKFKGIERYINWLKLK